MRLIDADKLRETLQRLSYDDWNQGASTSWAEAYSEIADMINAIPTVEVEPIKHGHWIKMSDADGYYYACSECGEELTRIQSFDPQFDLFPKLESINKTQFCPNCGAKMDEVEE